MNFRAVEKLLPPLLYQGALQCAAEIKFRLYPDKDILAKNKDLMGLGRGKRAFLLATGPSIKLENLAVLEGEDCFSISNFFLHDEIHRIRPLFHGFAPYHEPLILDNYIKWLHLADKELPADTKIILGHSSYDMVRQYDLFPNRDIYYLYLTPHPHGKHVDLLRPILAPQTGPLLLLPLLLYMGYQEIYLLGCDHTTLRYFKKNVINFYDSGSDIRENATDTKSWSNIINELSANMKVFNQYNYYNEKLRYMHETTIINLSNDTWLDVFVRSSLTTICRQI